MPDASVQQKHGQEVASLARRRADQFFDRLAAFPFLAIIVEGENVHIYAREDVGPEELARIKRSIVSMIEETDIGKVR